MPPFSIDWMAPAAGLGIGLVVGETGRSGGPLTTPWLTGVCPWAPAVAPARPGPVDRRVTARPPSGPIAASVAPIVHMRTARPPWLAAPRGPARRAPPRMATPTRAPLA